MVAGANLVTHLLAAHGVHPFHHYHSNGHETLGIYSGEVTVQFGGEAGIAITAKPGDVIVLPAGTGHKMLSSRGSLFDYWKPGQP